MKKLLAAAVLLAVLSPVFAQEEYTLYYSGDVTGFITIQKDNKGKITITPKVSSNKTEMTPKTIGHSLCPLIPAESSFDLDFYTASVIIDGNTTTTTYSDGSWTKTVVDGNTTMETQPGGYWLKTVVDGNTTMKTYSDGRWEKTVVDGSTTMETRSDGRWWKTVVDGNTTMDTYSDGSWTKMIVDGNTTVYTTSSGYWEKTEVDGNTTMESWSNGDWWKEVVDTQGHNIFITVDFNGYWGGV